MRCARRSSEGRPSSVVLHVAALGSGSSGNSLLVRTRETLLLVDCGFTLKETRRRMDGLGISPERLDGILVTHEHGDHLKGVGPVSRKFGVPVWLTHGTWRSARDQRFAAVNLFDAHEPFRIGDIEVDPFPTPHDAAESCQFVFSAGGVRFANLTDLGACTPHVRRMIEGVDGLVVECNYDPAMLREGPYPPMLQARIRSDWGHLGNDQAGAMLSKLDHAGLRWILLGHLSEQNNTGEVAHATVCEHLDGGHERVVVLDQHVESAWFTVGDEAAAAPFAERRTRKVELV